MYNNGPEPLSIARQAIVLNILSESRCSLIKPRGAPWKGHLAVIHQPQLALEGQPPTFDLSGTRAELCPFRDRNFANI